MNNNIFLNARVKNKDNQIGTIVSIDNQYIVVQYDDQTKTYSKEFVLKNNLFEFENDDLNEFIKQEQDNKKELLIKEQKEKKEIKDYRNKIINRYKYLKEKNDILKKLFGIDFEYPPFIEFMKKHKYLIDKKSGLFSIFWEYKYSD